MILNSTGRKWELTFTTLVTFGGAFFASFPLFYSTSFGGAYWVWVLLLITFVFQAVAYEFQNKKDNLLGVKGFRIALMANGLLAPFLVGTAVGTFFTGSDFTVNKVAITDPSSPVISTWGNNWHGLEALGQYHAVLLGCSIMFLAAILGALYVLNNVDDDGIQAQMRRSIKIAIGPFLLFFLSWTAILLCKEGYAVEPLPWSRSSIGTTCWTCRRCCACFWWVWCWCCSACTWALSASPAKASGMPCPARCWW